MRRLRLPADFLFFALAVGLQAAEIARELFLELLHFLVFSGGGGFGDLVFEEELAFGDFGAVEGIDFGDLRLLLIGDFGAGALLLQAFHGELVRGFHKLEVEAWQ